MEHETFVKGWMEMVENNKDLNWLSQKLGIPSTTNLSQTAAVLRRKGVDLPRLVGHNKVEVEKLNNIIKHHTNK